MKLVLVALSLGLGLGACVTDDPESVHRLEPHTVATEHNVINEILLGDTEPLNVNNVVVVVGLPSPNPTANVIDLSTVEDRTATPQAVALCKLSQDLPFDDVCSSLCENNFAARVFATNGSQQDCTHQTCVIDGQNIGVDVCR